MPRPLPPAHRLLRMWQENESELNEGSMRSESIARASINWKMNEARHCHTLIVYFRGNLKKAGKAEKRENRKTENRTE